MFRLTVLGLVGLASSFAVADDDLLPANRPNFSSNATVVPYNMCILETGVTYQRQDSSLNFSGLEAAVRLGFAKNWELALSLPNYVSGAAPRGWTDGRFDFIRQLPGCHGWDMLVAFGSSVPTGSRPVISWVGLLPTRSGTRLRRKRRWFKKNCSRSRYEPPSWRRNRWPAKMCVSLARLADMT